ncbi:MAG: cytochrome c oxidase assembly protein [Chloroflexi bacterium]|nr:cytochrome c oxidase assembly protein [Chloroflexota bacterium]
MLLAAAAVAYALAYRSAYRAGRVVPSRWRAVSFMGGIAVVAAALLGPIDTLSEALFSAHMVQHMLLIIAAPPLLVLGRPLLVILRGLPSVQRRALLRYTLGRRPVRSVLAVVGRPVSVALLVNGGMVGWHLPPSYAAALQHPLVHVLEHGSFFLSALLLWWELTGPELPRGQRWSTSESLLVLFTTWMVGDLLGATLALASTSFYPVYAETTTAWGLTPLADQQLGGAIMWIAGGAFFAGVMLCLLVRAYRRPIAPADPNARRSS